MRGRSRHTWSNMDFSSAVVAVAAGIFACEQVRQAVSVTTACRERARRTYTHKQTSVSAMTMTSANTQQMCHWNRTIGLVTTEISQAIWSNWRWVNLWSHHAGVTNWPDWVRSADWVTSFISNWAFSCPTRKKECVANHA